MLSSNIQATWVGLSSLIQRESSDARMPSTEACRTVARLRNAADASSRGSAVRKEKAAKNGSVGGVTFHHRFRKSVSNSASPLSVISYDVRAGRPPTWSVPTSRSISSSASLRRP